MLEEDCQIPPEGGATWLGASWVLFADVVGASLLTLNYVAAELGWLFTGAWLVAACSLATYSALLMSRTYLLLRKRGFIVTSMGEAARYTLGGRPAAITVFSAVYGFAVLGNASYLLVLGQALKGTLNGLVPLDLIGAVIISAVCCAPFVCLIRKVRETTALSFGNSLILYAVLAVVLGSLANRGPVPGVRTELVAAGLCAPTFFGASTNVLYAFASHWLYFELMSEMEDAEEFPKVLSLNSPLQLILYFMTAGVSYHYLGGPASSLNAGGLIEDMPPGDWLQVTSSSWLLLPNATNVAQGLLFLHVTIVFLVKSVVVTRFLAMCVSPGSEESTSWRARGVYAACGAGLLVLSVLLSLALPCFNLFLGLVGGLLAAPISYLFPVVFYLGALGRAGAGTSGDVRQRSLTESANYFLRQVTGESVASEALSEPGQKESRQITFEPTDHFSRITTEPSVHERTPRIFPTARERVHQRWTKVRPASSRTLDALLGRANLIFSQARPEESPPFSWSSVRAQLLWYDYLSLGTLVAVAALCSCLGTFAEFKAIMAVAH